MKFCVFRSRAYARRSTPKEWSLIWNLRIQYHTNTATKNFLWIRLLGTYLLNSNSQNLHEMQVFWKGPYILIFKPPGENIKNLWQHGSQSLRNKISWFCHVWNLSNQKSIWGGKPYLNFKTFMWHQALCLMCADQKFRNNFLEFFYNRQSLFPISVGLE